MDFIKKTRQTILFIPKYLSFPSLKESEEKFWDFTLTALNFLVNMRPKFYKMSHYEDIKKKYKKVNNCRFILCSQPEDI